MIFLILNTCFNLTGYEEVNIYTLKEMQKWMWMLRRFFLLCKIDASLIILVFASLAYEDHIVIIENYQPYKINLSWFC